MQPELFDVVELLVPLPEQNLQPGAHGAIVDLLDRTAYEIEFTNEAGETLAQVALTPSQFVVAWKAATKTWVPSIEKLQALAPYLSEEKCQEVLDFALFLHGRPGVAS